MNQSNYDNKNSTQRQLVFLIKWPDKYIKTAFKMISYLEKEKRKNAKY